MNGVASQRARTEASAVRRIVEAAEAVASAKRGQAEHAIVKAQRDLREVVQAANDSGVSWQSIGEILGIRRGAAYQRFRRQRADYAAPRRR
jgi:DNA-directed RNA polymerase specialized sigma24 family protein